MRNDHLAHHGILGQKWGVRRFQDYDGKRIGASAEDRYSDIYTEKGVFKLPHVFLQEAVQNVMISSEAQVHKKQYQFGDIRRHGCY